MSPDPQPVGAGTGEPHKSTDLIAEVQKKKIACSVDVGAWTCLRLRGLCYGRGVLVALYVQGVWRYRTRSSAHRARTRVRGVYECERYQLFFALFDLESQFSGRS